MKPILEIQNISKKFRIQHENQPYLSLRDSLTSVFKKKTSTSEEFYALKDVSFTVNPGESVGIIGRNGAGKSTLLKILSSITPPSSGRIITRGRIASLLEVGTGFHPELTGRENVFLNGSILGMRREEILKKFDEILNFAEVEKFIDTPLKHYSSGMQLRLAFAVAAFLENEILIIDEVLAVGDAEFQKKCMDKMKSTVSEGRTILFVTHNLGIIGAFCPKTILLNKGQLVAIDKTDKMVSNYLKLNTDNNLIKKITNEDRVRGNGKVKIVECTIYSKLDNLKSEFSIRENFKINFTINSNFIGKIGFWVIFRDHQGTPILCTHQKDSCELSIEKGIFKIIYETNNISLLPGFYILTAGILNDHYTEFYDWVDNCQTFEILPAFSNGTNYDNRLGYAHQDATWKIEKN